MWRNIHPDNTHYIQSMALRKAAAEAVASGRSVEFLACPSSFDPAGFVETVVVDGVRAGQASDLSPHVVWGRWDAAHDALLLDDGSALGLRGEYSEAARSPGGPRVEEARDTGPREAALSSEATLEQRVRAAVGRSRNLLELFFAVQQNLALVLLLSTEERLRVLPRFDDSAPPWIMEDVWAWDASQVIVFMDNKLQLVGRQHWEH